MALGEELVEPFLELGHLAAWVGHNSVIVIPETAHRVDQNPVPLCGDRETEPEDLIHDRIGTQQKLPLGAAAGDKVRSAGNDLPWSGHSNLQQEPRSSRGGTGEPERDRDGECT